MQLHEEVQARCEDLGSECRIWLTGRITIDSSPCVRRLLLERLESALCMSLVLDLSEVSYVDTSGVVIFVESLRAARGQGKAFGLTGLQERPRYLLEATRLLRLFDEAPGESPAVYSPRGSTR
jgi:anti-sigma B factor antagonist